MDIEKAFGVEPGLARERYLKYSVEEELTWDEYQQIRIQDWNNNTEGQNAREIFEQALDDNFERHGVRKEAKWLIDFFHEQDFETYLISHAPDAYSKIGQEECGIQNHVDTIGIKMDGHVEDIREKEDYCKKSFVEGLQDEGYEVWFFGNGSNDFEAAETADHGYLMDNLDDLDYSQIEAYKGNLEDVCCQVGQQFRGDTIES